MKFNVIIFLNEPKDSINRKARIERNKNGTYFIANMNMPYQGTISEIWSEEKLQNKIRNKEIKLE